MEQLYELIHEKVRAKQDGSQRLAAEITTGMIRGTKYWTLEMVRNIISSISFKKSFILL